MPQSEVMYDSVTGGDLPPTATLVLYYVDGLYANYNAVRAQCPHARLIGVTTTISGNLDAVVYDCERGDGNAKQAAAWARTKIMLHERPTIYCSRIGSPGYGWPDVQAALTALSIPLSSVDFGIADYTGQMHLVPGSAFTQYENPPSSGGDYDKSITNGSWPNVPTPQETGVLNKPAAEIIGTKSNNGYWIVAQDGGVFAYGDALFLGSLPSRGIVPSAPIVSVEVTTTEKGYRMLGSDGGVFCFGDAMFYGAANAP